MDEQIEQLNPYLKGFLLIALVFLLPVILCFLFCLAPFLVIAFLVHKVCNVPVEIKDISAKLEYRLKTNEGYQKFLYKLKD